MPVSLVGRKVGMTRVFTENGASLPVTVVEVTPNRITRLLSPERDGYRAYQVTVGTVRPSAVKRPQAGFFAKINVDAGRGLWEFRLKEGEGDDLAVGGSLDVSIFEKGQRVDVAGRTIGKGFAGVVKRHGFHMQDATHGNSLSHRAPGSIGQNQTPGRVFKGKPMAGHMGSVRRKVQNLRVVDIDVERHCILVHGALPGSRGTDLIVSPSVKVRV